MLLDTMPLIGLKGWFVEKRNEEWFLKNETLEYSLGNILTAESVANIIGLSCSLEVDGIYVITPKIVRHLHPTLKDLKIVNIK